MFSVSISVQIPELDRIALEIDCPVCALSTRVTLGDIRLGGVTICRGCHANIRLEDHLAQYHRARRRLMNAFATFGGGR